MKILLLTGLLFVVETEPDKETVRIISADDLPPLDEDRIKKLKKMRDKDIDFSDMPAMTQEQLAKFVPAKLLNRSLYRPVKIPVKINYDADLLEWFRSFGKGYQTRINSALREYMLTHCGS